MKLESISFEKALKDENAAFVYSLETIQNNVLMLEKYFQGLTGDSRSSLYFSVKSNPNPVILSEIAKLVSGFDLSSYKELCLLKKLKLDHLPLSVSGPAKTDPFLAELVSMENVVIHIDNIEEFNFLKKFDELKAKVGLRHKSFGKNSKLGLSQKQIEIILNDTIPIDGLHYYIGRESYTLEELKKVVETFSDIEKKNNRELNYYIGPGVRDLVTQDLTLSSNQSLGVMKKIVFEVGRSLLSNAGVYIAPILSVKTVKKKKVIMIDGGLQHLGAPLFTPGSPLEIRPVVIRDNRPIGNGKLEHFYLYGSLCMGTDLLYPNIEVCSDICRGDYLLFENCGAYGLSAGISQFIGENLPSEWLLEHNSMREITDENYKPYLESF